MNKYLLSAYLFTASLIVGCATSNPSSDDESEPRPPRDCFRVESIQNWKVIDNRTLVVWAPNRRTAYRVDLFSSCGGLSFAQEIGFQSGLGSRICGIPGDAIRIRDTGSCGITGVSALSPLHLEALTNPEIDPDIGKLPETND